MTSRYVLTRFPEFFSGVGQKHINQNESFKIYHVDCGNDVYPFRIRTNRGTTPGGIIKMRSCLARRAPNYGSSARVQGFGGASASLGGDISVAGVNPAGIGFFNRSVFSVTPGMNFHNADASYLSNSVTLNQK